MAEDELERLKKLAELRERGVLSEAEFQNAKARLLGTGAPPRPSAMGAGGKGAGEKSILRAYWPAFAGVGILILLVIGVIVYGSLSADDDDQGMNFAITSDMAGNVLDAVPGEALCASGEAFIRIKDMIFDRAVRQFGGDPAPLDSLRRSVGVRMQYPMLRGVRQDIGRTDCSGRIILDLPPSVRSAFDGVPSLEADVEYSFQSAANGSGRVVEAAGVDYVVQQLAIAAGLVGAQRDALAGGVQLQKTFSPSFDCGARLSNVERMICQDEGLSQIDRTLAGRYTTLKERLTANEWQLVSESQREFLQRRAGCADVACVRDAYVAQGRYLNQFEARDIDTTG